MTVAATEVLTKANARDQRVIPGIAIDFLSNADPAQQAIGTVAARKVLTVAPARDQRVIPGFAIEALKSPVPAQQSIGITTAKDVFNPGQTVIARRAG